MGIAPGRQSSVSSKVVPAKQKWVVYYTLLEKKTTLKRYRIIQGRQWKGVEESAGIIT